MWVPSLIIWYTVNSSFRTKRILKELFNGNESGHNTHWNCFSASISTMPLCAPFCTFNIKHNNVNIASSPFPRFQVLFQKQHEHNDDNNNLTQQIERRFSLLNLSLICHIMSISRVVYIYFFHAYMPMFSYHIYFSLYKVVSIFKERS